MSFQRVFQWNTFIWHSIDRSNAFNLSIHRKQIIPLCMFSSNETTTHDAKISLHGYVMNFLNSTLMTAICLVMNEIKKKQLRSEHQNGFEFLVLLLHISNNVSPLLLHKHIVKILVLSVVSVIFFLLLSTIDRIFFSPQHHLRYDANKIKTIYVPPVQGV